MSVNLASSQAAVQALQGSEPGPEISRPKAAPSSGQKAWQASLPLILGISSILCIIAVWQMATSYQLVNPLFLSPPLAVVNAIIDLVTSGDLLFHLSVSAEEFGLGLGISIFMGALLGVITGWYPRAEQFLRPVVIAINSMPHVAVIPVLILLFGIGLTPKVFIVVLSCTVTILLNTAAGVTNVEPHLMRMSRSFGSTDFQAIRTVVLPSMIPFFMTGVRISVGRALIAVVVSEFFASKAGVGNVMISAANSFNMPRMYGMLFIITTLGVALTQGATWVELRIQRWRG